VPQYPRPSICLRDEVQIREQIRMRAAEIEHVLRSTADFYLQSGKSIFLRSLDDPSLSKQYIGHTSGTTVARFSPSGYYIASGDVSGSVMVWDAIEGVNTKGTRTVPV